MSIAPYIKDIGRGAQGARALDAVTAQKVMGLVLDGQVSDLEVGAFVMALRMKGETLAELEGFLAAVQARCQHWQSEQPVVLIPSYNGARRLPNLVPLLAMALAQEGARVLVHGQPSDPGRVTTAEVFRDLGLPVAHNASDAHSAWARREPAFVHTATLCPPLQRLLDVRRAVGVRNAGHTVAKMLNPIQGSRTLRLVNFTHPEFGRLMAQWAEHSACDTLLLRGTEGEAVADPRRQPRMDTWLQGQTCTELSAPAHDGVVTELPLLPRENDAATTALYVQAVLGGEKPLPAPMARQVQLVVGALARLRSEQPALGQTA
ncbi:MAG: DNA-binding protein YbiB [Rubrivivax sp.]